MTVIKAEDLATTFASAEAITEDSEQILADIRFHQGQFVPTKAGGETYEPTYDPGFNVSDSVHRDIVLMKKLGVHPILIHGGGKQIGRAIGDAVKSGITGIYNEVVNGIRIVNDKGLEYSMRVGEQMRRNIAKDITRIGARSNIRGVQVPGTDIVRAYAMYKDEMRTGTLGTQRFVEQGDYKSLRDHVTKLVEVDYLRKIAEDPNCIPVIDWHCASADDDGSYTLNADEMWMAISIALGVNRSLGLSSDRNRAYRGVHNAQGDLYSRLKTKEAKALIDDGTASEGMAVKLENCITMINCGVEGVAIVNPAFRGAVKHELGAQVGAGTLITNKEKLDRQYRHQSMPVPSVG